MPADIAEMLTSIADNCYIIYVPWTQIVTNYLWNVRIIRWAHNYHLRSLAGVFHPYLSEVAFSNQF